MDVDLYIYDLSQGLARMYSAALTGTQIDAIYHTSLVLNGVEYYFGQGIQTAVPGSTHHGAPMEKLHLGKTEIPTDVVEEYLQSMSEIYTPESYDLFLHNCNNFTQDLAMFLVGKSIPEKIRNLPRTFLDTPFGQMMKPHIESSLRGVTQAPGTSFQPSSSGAAAPPAATATSSATAASTNAAPSGIVHIVSNLSQLEERLSAAAQCCAVIFFTSATCPPCKMVYPTYDELAEEAGNKAVLIKVDISTAMDVSMKYSVRATPTFMTFVRGKKVDQWSGADPAQLRGNVRLLIEMAYPTHPHRQLHLPTLQRRISSYVTYKKVPPLDKLAQKLHPHDDSPALRSILDFLSRRFASSEPAADTPLPTDLPSFAAYIQTTAKALPRDTLFALVDLARLLFLDPRIAGFFAEEPSHTTLLTLLSPVTGDNDITTYPYNLRLVLLHLACNLFTSPVSRDQLSSNESLCTALLALSTSSLLDPTRNLRVVAASLAYNLAAYNHNTRFEGSDDPLPEEAQVELTASLVEAIAQENESPEALHGLLFALGLLVYEAPVGGMVEDVCKALGVVETVKEKRVAGGELAKEKLLVEVGEGLLGRL